MSKFRVPTTIERKDRSGYLYVVKLPWGDEPDQNYYKIGRTTNPQRRLKEIKNNREWTTPGYEPFFVLLIKVPDAVRTETYWHNQFYKKRFASRVRLSELFALDIEDIADMYRYFQAVRVYKYSAQKFAFEGRY